MITPIRLPYDKRVLIEAIARFPKTVR
jgi:hypothetical protein